MMTARAEQTSAPDLSLKFVSGDPGPDLVNTIDWTRDGVANERLTDYERLTRWAAGAGVLSRSEATALRDTARAHPEAAAEAVEDARRLRWLLQRLLASVARRKQDAAAWQEFGEYLEDALGHLLLEPRPLARKGGRAASWSWRGAGERLDWFLWPVVRSTAELLSSDEAHRIRVCDGDGCGWMFVDRSRNRLRRWCEMETCGTAAKSRRRRERRAQEGEPSATRRAPRQKGTP